MKHYFHIAYGGIGEFVMILLVLENIHQSDPTTQIHMITTRNHSLIKDLASPYSFVQIHHGGEATLTKLVLLIRFILWYGWRRGTTVVANPTLNLTPRYIRIFGWLLASRGIFVGFAQRRSDYFERFYDVLLPYDTQTPIYKQYLSVVTRLNLPLHYRNPKYLLPHQLIGEFLVVAPFGSNLLKRSLPISRWVKLLRFLSRTYRLPIALIGSPDEYTLAEDIIFQSGVLVKNECGSSIQRIISLIATSPLFIGIDSGYSHLAGALRINAIEIGNLSNPYWLVTYSHKTTILYNDKNCQCNGDKTGDCLVIFEGRKHLRCVIDIPQPQLESTILEKLAPQQTAGYYVLARK